MRDREEVIAADQQTWLRQVNREYDRAFQTWQDGWRWIFRGGGE